MTALDGFIKPFPYVVAIVQAREGGTRFPGKVLADLGGKPVLQHVIERACLAKEVHSVCFTTPSKRISDLASSLGVFGHWYRGDENDLVARYVAAADWCGADIIVRLTADSPLVDPSLIDLGVRRLWDHDFYSNVWERNLAGAKLPKGLEVEVFPRDTLTRLDRLSKGHPSREHCVKFIYDTHFLWDVARDGIAPNVQINWSIDTPADLNRVAYVVKVAPFSVTHTDILSVLRQQEGL